MDEHDRYALRVAAESLSREARLARARLDANSAERTFLLGVEAALLTVLHPELTSVHTDEWLARREPSFRDGYIRARAVFAAAASTHPTPTRVRMPDPSVAAGG